MDDGSTDNTAELMAGLAAGDPRIRVLTQANAGKGAALNLGIRNATGEVLMFVDADGIFSRYTVEKMLQGFEDGRTGAVCGDDRPVNLNRAQTRMLAFISHIGTGMVRRALTVIGCLPIVSGNIGAFPRKVVEEIGPVPRRHGGRGPGTDLAGAQGGLPRCLHAAGAGLRRIPVDHRGPVAAAGPVGPRPAADHGRPQGHDRQSPARQVRRLPAVQRHHHGGPARGPDPGPPRPGVPARPGLQPARRRRLGGPGLARHHRDARSDGVRPGHEPGMERPAAYLGAAADPVVFRVHQPDHGRRPQPGTAQEGSPLEQAHPDRDRQRQLSRRHARKCGLETRLWASCPCWRSP